MSSGMNIKSNLRKFIAWAFYYSGFYRLYRRGNVRILMYHRVLKDNDKTIASIQPGMYVTESAFENQMKYLSKHYHLISLAELFELWAEGRFSKDKRYCIVTFDDGWLDNYLNAYPILKKHNIPATIFLATSYIGTDRWFWPEKLSYLLSNKHQDILDFGDRLEEVGDDVISSILSAITEKHDFNIMGQTDFVTESLKQYSEASIENALDRIYKLLDIILPKERALLNWEEVKEMSRNGITFGSHTCNHKILTSLSSNEAKKELDDSMRLLKEKELDFIPVFCYPNGSYDHEVQKLVKASGYEAAVTTQYGFADEDPHNYFTIKRIGVHNDISSSTPLFSLHLSGLQSVLTR